MSDLEIKIQDVENNINKTIEMVVKDYKTNGASIWNNHQRFRICGMIEVLKILTGKDYFFDENGLHERNGG